MPIVDLHVTNVGPFDDIAFEFDKHVNVFVGPNNSGKSTVLLVLGAIAGTGLDFPSKLLKKAPFEFILHVTAAGSGKKTLRGFIPANRAVLEDKKLRQHYVEILKEIGYTSFIPPLRQSTDF